MQRILTVLAIAACLRAPGCATTIGVSPVSPILAGSPGDTLTFKGTLSNNSGADLYINGAELILNGFSSTTLDSSQFLVNAPAILTNGMSTSAFAFFNVAIPAGFKSGPYTGTFTITGGSTGSAHDPLGTASFTVSTGATLPALDVSPSTLTFTGTGTASQTLSVSSSSSTSPLNFSATATTTGGGNWLSVTPSSGTTPGTLTVSVNPAGLSGTYTGAINVASSGAAASTTTIAVTLSTTPPGQLPQISAVTNGASFVPGSLVPGSIATIFGVNLTSSAGVNLTSSLPLPTHFLNVAVNVNGFPAPIFAVDNVAGQQQINFQTPWEVAGLSSATISVALNGVTGTPIIVPVLSAQPGIIAYSTNGGSFGAILHSNNFQLVDATQPASAGETVLIYCTGLGAVTPAQQSGVAAGAATTAVTPSVTIGGTAASVAYGGLAPGFAGLYQVNAVVPAGLGAGNAPVVITMGTAGSNSVLLPTQ